MPSNRLWKSTAFAVAAAGFTATLVPTTVQAQSYNIAQTIQGESFFDAFTYFGSFDNMTSGDVIFVDEQTGVSDRLTYINDAGNAIVKVDNTTFVPYNEKRNAVMLTSKNKYKTGTVWVFDALHVPSGCSVWGALWSRGAYANWPAGGEIDIFEGINQMQYNQMALHTTEGCTKPADVEQTGTTGLTDCNYEVNTNAGCTVQDRNPNSYGDAFAAVGGGVWITQFETTGINIWFFARPDIPTSVGGDSLDVSTLGTPTASYPASSCEIDRFFVEQEIIIDIKLCGTWAGVPSILEETCPPLESPLTCYTTYVIDNKSTYDKAYFELTSVKIYADSPDAVIVAEDSTSSTNSGTGSTPTGGGGGGSAGFRSVAAINPVVAGMVAMMVGAFSFGVMAVRF